MMDNREKIDHAAKVRETLETWFMTENEEIEARQEALTHLDALEAERQALDRVDRSVYELTVKQRDLAWEQLRTAETVERELEASAKADTKRIAELEAALREAGRLVGLLRSGMSGEMIEKEVVRVQALARAALAGQDAGGEGRA